MRQSKKETILLQAEHRLLHNDMHQALGMQAASFAVESAQEWASGSASVKQSPSKPVR